MTFGSLVYEMRPHRIPYMSQLIEICNAKPIENFDRKKSFVVQGHYSLNLMKL